MDTLVKLIDRAENAWREVCLGRMTHAFYCEIRDHAMHVIITCIAAGVVLSLDVQGWLNQMQDGSYPL